MVICYSIKIEFRISFRCSSKKQPFVTDGNVTNGELELKRQLNLINYRNDVIYCFYMQFQFVSPLMDQSLIAYTN